MDGARQATLSRAPPPRGEGEGVGGHSGGPSWAPLPHKGGGNGKAVLLGAGR